jgi:hypothetical protein
MITAPHILFFENEEDDRKILEFVKTYSFPSDCLYYISRNKHIIQNDSFTQNMIELFTFYYEKGDLQNAVYTWLDGWDDSWSSSREKLDVRIIGTYITRLYAEESFRLKMKDVFQYILPYFGETEVYCYYRDLVHKDFDVE